MIQDYWHDYECIPCGIQLNLRQAAEAPPALPCPFCSQPLHHRATSPAIEGGFHVEEGWTPDRAATCLLDRLREAAVDHALAFQEGSEEGPERIHSALRRACIAAFRTFQLPYRP